MTAIEKEPSSIPGPNQLEIDPDRAEATRDIKAPENGNNPFDVFKFLSKELSGTIYFGKLFLHMTESMSERNIIYWIIFGFCYLPQWLYYILIHLLKLFVLTIIVYGLAKVVGFDVFVFELMKL